MKTKTLAYFCKDCGNWASHILIDNEWYCLACNPLLLPDPVLTGFTIGEVVNMRGTNGQEHSSKISEK